jgi:hypothetical protein
MRPYISIDIETTGIDPRSEILQISGVIDNSVELEEFDIPKIRAFFQKHANGPALNEFDTLCHYKTLDVGSLYFDVFGDNASLSKINELTGRKEVSHNALDDAYDVVYAVRHKLGDKK